MHQETHQPLGGSIFGLGLLRFFCVARIASKSFPLKLFAYRTSCLNTWIHLGSTFSSKLAIDWSARHLTWTTTTTTTKTIKTTWTTWTPNFRSISITTTATIPTSTSTTMNSLQSTNRTTLSPQLCLMIALWWPAPIWYLNTKLPIIASQTYTWPTNTIS